MEMSLFSPLLGKIIWENYFMPSIYLWGSCEKFEYRLQLRRPCKKKDEFATYLSNYGAT
jgi:hypothetical protein